MKKTILAMLAASVCAAAMATPVKGDKAQLHFLETTDVHGSFFPIDFISGKSIDGSMARVSASHGSHRSHRIFTPNVKSHRGLRLLLEAYSIRFTHLFYPFKPNLHRF